MRRKVVLIQGAFDILNYGHVRALEFSKRQGDYLIVALNGHALLEDYKRRSPVMSWWQKKRILESIHCVDKVVKATEFSPLNLLKKYNVDVYVLSREHKWTKAREMAYMKAKGGRVCFSRRFNGVSTSEIKVKLVKEYFHAAGGAHAVSAKSRNGSGNGAANGHGTMPTIDKNVFISGEALRALWERKYGPFGP